MSEIDQKRPQSAKDVVESELEKKGDGGIWLWTVFLLCLTPNILNGFHVNSYVFLSTPPDSNTCIIPELNQLGWTNEEIKNISTKDPTKNQSCSILAWNYSKLSSMSHLEALNYTKNVEIPEEIPCLSRTGNYFHYEQIPGRSIVPEWDLVCERTALRTNVQVALSVGKFFGATTFGVISDKFGRKFSFSLGCFTYILGSILVSWSPDYIFLLLGRFFLGSASSGLFYPTFTLLTENIAPRHRSWMGISFSFSYPIGMMILALTAYLVRPWRALSLTLTIPSFLLIVHLWFLVESPRWLISRGRESRAYKMLFGHSMPKEMKAELKVLKEKEALVQERAPNQTQSFTKRLKQRFSILVSLYGPSVLRKRALICHFTWCVTSLCYYVTALNADNLAANRYVYVAATGTVDLIGYMICIVILRYVGRRPSSCALFGLAGVCLLVVLGIPKENKAIMVIFAMLGRFGVTAVYAIMTLHTAEMFPTDIRNTALGISSTCAHVGGIAAPYIVDLLGQLFWFIPTTICGVTILLAGLLTLAQPETRNSHLKDHVEEEETSEELELKD